MHAPLLPVLRRITAPPHALLLADQHPGAALLRRPFAPFLSLALVEDRPSTRRFVQHDDLIRWNTTAEQLWLAARLELGSRSHEPVEPIEGGVRVSGWGGYASSLVTLPGWWRAVGEQVDGDPVALAPDIDELIVIGSRSPSLPRWLEWAFQSFRETERPLSPAPLFDPSRAPRNEKLLRTFLYAEQDEVLLQTAPEGVYVAEISLRLGPDGASTSTRCEPGFPCWLPEADVVQTPEGLVPLASLNLPVVPGVKPTRYLWR